MPGRRALALLVTLGILLALPAPAGALEPRWPELEAYYEGLLGCTRSGGWVNEDGTCDMVDVEERVPLVPALRRTRILSDELARPHARRLALAGYLSHDLGGSIRDRFARIGRANGRYGENLGYSGGRDPMAAILHIHLMFQEEWSYGGWHWRNMTDARFTKVGIGAWVRDDRTYLVVDFHS
jgi:hypothetical protein